MERGNATGIIYTAGAYLLWAILPNLLEVYK